MSARMSWLDFKLGARMLFKYPGLTLVGGLALAFGITLGAAYFELVNDTLRPTLPLDQGDRVVGIQNWDRAAASPQLRSIRDFAAWREEISSVQDMGAFRTVERNLIVDNGVAAPATGAEMSASGFKLARVPAQLGRTLLPTDEQEGAPPVVVLGHRMWQGRFGGDPSVVGRTVRLGSVVTTVVGVMPEGFAFPVSHQLWMPLRLNPLLYPRGQGPEIQVFGRLAPGATVEKVQAELTVLGRRAAAESPDTLKHVQPRVMPYTELFGAGGGAGTQLYWFQAIFVMVLLVISANVATLVFARTVTREGEIVVRHALGASRGRIVMQIFVEALVLGLVAAAIGLVVVSWGLKRAMSLFFDAMGGAAPFWWNNTLSPSTVVYAVGLAILGAVVTGVVPALKATGPLVQTGLRNAAVGGDSGVKFGRVWAVMIITQVAFAVAILPGAIAGVMGWIRAESADLGFPAEQFLSVRLEMDPENPATDSAMTPAFLARFQARYQELGRRVGAEPGVSGVTFADRFPGMDHPKPRIEVDGVPAPAGSAVGHEVQTASVDGGFFDALQAPIVAGRKFSGADRDVVIVNQAFVKDVLGDRNAVGKRIRYPGARGGQPGPWIEIVGVVRNLGMDRSRDLLKGGTPAGMYHPLAADPGAPGGAYPVRMAVHVQGDPRLFVPRLRGLAATLDPNVRLYDLVPLDGPADEGNRKERLLNNFLASVLALMALMALFVSAAGTYSLMSFTVSRRTREIGIRAALGANPRQIVTAIFSRGLTQIGIGVLVGGAIYGAMVVAGAGAGNPATGNEMGLLAMVAAMMMLVGVLACGMPARRALRIEPTEAMRQV
ncbi:MAG TPA: ABC transporter permease [Longimicrobium sp.]|nr:ABC transporter permease [Longimicrobium sp.]